MRILTRFKTFCKAIVIKPILSLCQKRQIYKSNRIETLEIDTCIYGNMIYYEMAPKSIVKRYEGKQLL